MRSSNHYLHFDDWFLLIFENFFVLSLSRTRVLVFLIQSVSRNTQHDLISSFVPSEKVLVECLVRRTVEHSPITEFIKTVFIGRQMNLCYLELKLFTSVYRLTLLTTHSHDLTRFYQRGNLFDNLFFKYHPFQTRDVVTPV